MKKAYTKPLVVFDCFELADNVAAGCTFISTNQSPYECPIYDPEMDITLFSDIITCGTTPPGGNDSICYNVPMADWSVYIS